MNAVQASHTTGSLARGSAPRAARKAARVVWETTHSLTPQGLPGRPRHSRRVTSLCAGIGPSGGELTGRPAPVLGDTRTRAAGPAGPWGARGTGLPRLCPCSENVFARERPHTGRGAWLPRAALPGRGAGLELRKSDCRGSVAELFTTSGLGNRLAGPTQRGGPGHLDSESIDLYLKSKLPLTKGVSLQGHRSSVGEERIFSTPGIKCWRSDPVALRPWTTPREQRSTETTHRGFTQRPFGESAQIPSEAVVLTIEEKS